MEMGGVGNDDHSSGGGDHGGGDGREHVVMFPFMAKGHTVPVIHLAAALSRRGLRVTILTTPANAPFLRRSLPRLRVSLLSLPFPSTRASPRARVHRPPPPDLYPTSTPPSSAPPRSSAPRSAASYSNSSPTPPPPPLARSASSPTSYSPGPSPSPAASASPPSSSTACPSSPWPCASPSSPRSSPHPPPPPPPPSPPPLMAATKSPSPSPGTRGASSSRRPRSPARGLPRRRRRARAWLVGPMSLLAARVNAEEEEDPTDHDPEGCPRGSTSTGPGGRVRGVRDAGPRGGRAAGRGGPRAGGVGPPVPLGRPIRDVGPAGAARRADPIPGQNRPGVGPAKRDTGPRGGRRIRDALRVELGAGEPVGREADAGVADDRRAGAQRQALGGDPGGRGEGAGQNERRIVTRDEVAAGVREVMGGGGERGQRARARAAELRDAAAAAVAEGGTSWVALENLLQELRKIKNYETASSNTENSMKDDVERHKKEEKSQQNGVQIV
uniref:Uncharacterized protein n=1 Tax=Ananas comosus var. bracteatus TaxID=296719 RepID=A0A6V7PAM3_ANACO|nr:unnamed protein product [Ananas comosus var. bracteatus]